MFTKLQEIDTWGKCGFVSKLHFGAISKYFGTDFEVLMAPSSEVPPHF